MHAVFCFILNETQGFKTFDIQLIENIGIWITVEHLNGGEEGRQLKLICPFCLFVKIQPFFSILVPA